MRIYHAFVCCIVFAGCSRGTIASLPTSGGLASAGALHSDARVHQALPAAIYKFKGPPGDGAAPGYGDGLIDVAGTLYGVTQSGGTGSCPDDNISRTCGTVYAITPAGVENVVYSLSLIHI